MTVWVTPDPGELPAEVDEGGIYMEDGEPNLATHSDIKRCQERQVNTKREHLRCTQSSYAPLPQFEEPEPYEEDEVLSGEAADVDIDIDIESAIGIDIELAIGIGIEVAIGIDFESAMSVDIESAIGVDIESGLLDPYLPFMSLPLSAGGEELLTPSKDEANLNLNRTGM